MKVLGIETSCDETAAAVVEDGYKLLSNVVASSVDLHAAYGGVVPEIAARSHIESILPVIDQALIDAFAENSNQKLENSKKTKLIPNSQLLIPQSDDIWSQIDAIAVTQGPGLIGSLLIGVLTARTLAIAKQKPLYAINHLEAHVYAAFLTSFGNEQKAKSKKQKTLEINYLFPKKQPEFPLLALIISGGHTQIVLFNNHFDYKMLGQTMDDAVGEAYDKVAKMLGLSYPGGPSIAKTAKKGNAYSFNFPKAKFDVKGRTFHTNAYPFSFSGLKTAVLRAAQDVTGHDYTFPSTKLPEALNKAQKADIAASFQRTVVETLVDALKKAEDEFQPKSIVIAGGVAANQELRKVASEQLSSKVIYPDIKLCTDNAAMVATLGCFKAKYKQPKANSYSLEVAPSLKMLTSH
ncbi:tRNA (adenosine(37)-N6)-threonylcarbamoyltransferase complex transferase subunit TsaD [Candidatus Saccharibacteria bacterium]|nr:tRNA (adenosine(37)-N6)-threonylcarbamoyltransferase complex transferase subunit TsaD [Candidatus Saccharibacteria bacterium]